MKIIVDKNFLTKDQKNFIKLHIFNTKFPWYLQTHFLDDSDEKNITNFFSHLVVRRVEETGNNMSYNSSFGPFVKEVLDTFCKKHKIKYKTIYRSVFNLTFNNGIDVCGTHKDHYNNLKHKQLLIYLNDPEDKNTPTVILNKKRNTIIKKTYPEQFKGILFNDEPHYMIFPKVGLRCVLITTFN